LKRTKENKPQLSSKAEKGKQPTVKKPTYCKQQVTATTEKYICW